MSLFIYHLKQAYHSLKPSPVFVFSVCSTMGITLGALLCVATFAYVLLIKPLPYPEQEQLHYVEHRLIDNNQQVDGNAFIYPNLIYLQQNQSIYRDSALLYVDADVVTSLPSEPMMEMFFVTPEWFQLFDISLAKGRGFEQSEAINTHHPVAVITYDTWQKQYGGSPDILEKTISFGGRSYQIIGVTAESHKPAAVAGTGLNIQLYIPWDFNTVSERDRNSWGNDDGSLIFVGKTPKESTLNPSQQSERLTALVNDNWQNQIGDIEFFKGWSVQLEASQLKDQLIAENKTSIYLLLIGALGLVFIASVNIANLLLSRTVGRQHQLAICAALGATRRQLFSSTLSEISLLMLVAVVIAQVVAVLGFHALRYYLNDSLPRIDELSLNAFSLVVSIALLLIFTLIFAKTCQQIIDYRCLNNSLQTSGKGQGLQVSKTTRNLLIVSQVAVASTLIFINIMLFQNAQTVIKQPLGYETRDTYAVVLSTGNLDSSVRANALTKLKTQLRSLPEVAMVSQAMRPSIFGTFALTTEQDSRRLTASGKDVDEQYFALINQTLLEGNAFTTAQVKDRERVLIVNDVMAKQLAPNGSALGLKFTNGSRIIGVVKSIKVPGVTQERSRFYYPASLSRNMLLIKVKPGQSISRDEIISQLKQVDNSLHLFSFSTLEQSKHQRLFGVKTTAMVTTALTLITFLLSTIGLFGILKYSCEMRKFEIGTHLAVGAKGRDIIALIVKENARSLALGIMISAFALVVIYLNFSQQLSHYLSLSLVITFLITGGLISLISWLACYLPLRQFIQNPVIFCLRNSE